MSAAECRNELVVASRRRHLSSGERAALAAHLASCDSCRVGLALGRAFDEGAALELEDGLRIAKLGIAARRWVESGASSGCITPRPRRTARTLLLAACLCLVAAGASAGAHLWARRAEVSPAPSIPAAKPPVAPAGPPAVARAVPREARAAPSPPEPLAVPSAAPGRIPARVREQPVATQSQRKPAQAPPDVESAEVLFRRASAARRAGDATLASALYKRLQREHPGASETKLSYLRLGSLFLERGDAGAALGQFDGHLRAPSSALVPEALYGRARALALLGRVAEERRTWEQLEARFPTSPYAAHARRRAGSPSSDHKDLR